jgi:hypothetical protein
MAIFVVAPYLAVTRRDLQGASAREVGPAAVAARRETR